VGASRLKPEWYATKRNGFYDINGDIHVSFSDGSKLEMGSDRDNLGQQFKLKVGQEECSVSESEGKARAADGRIVEG